MSIRPVSGPSLYLGWFGHGFGSLFLELLRCWRHRRRFCGKKQATAPPAEEEMCSEPANERVEGDEQSEASEPQQEEEAYEAELEAVLVELALKNRAIREREEALR